MAFDFLVDSDELKTLSEDLKKTYENIEDFVYRIDLEVDNLSNFWVGEDFDGFKSRCDYNKQKYIELASVFDEFAKETEAIASEAATLIESVESALNVSEMVVSGSDSY